jgi:hypothetical protein
MFWAVLSSSQMITPNVIGNAVIQADVNITIIIQTDDNIKYSRKHYYPAR